MYLLFLIFLQQIFNLPDATLYINCNFLNKVSFVY